MTGIINIIKSLNENPIYVREQYRIKRKAPKKNLWYYVKFAVKGLLYLLILISLLDFYEVDGSFILNSTTVYIFLVFFYVAVTIEMSVSQITGERDNKTYDQLISTAMPAFEIIKGKFWTVFKPRLREIAIFSFVVTCLLILRFGSFSVISIGAALFINLASLLAVSSLASFYTAQTTKKADKAPYYSFILILLIIFFAKVFMAICLILLFIISILFGYKDPSILGSNLIFIIMSVLDTIFYLMLAWEFLRRLYLNLRRIPEE